MNGSVVLGFHFGNPETKNPDVSFGDLGPTWTGDPSAAEERFVQLRLTFEGDVTSGAIAEPPSRS